MPNPTCPTNCDFDLPVVNFSDCSPSVVYSEIRRIFIAKKSAAPFANWLNPTEWIARLSQTATGDDAIRALTVIGDKPAGAPVSKAISNGRTIVVGKDHTVNFTIDDVTPENYEFMRVIECGGQGYKLWYETSGGFMYGGNDGIIGVNGLGLDMNDVLNRGLDEIETINGVATWRNKFSPERGISPIFDGGSSSVPTTFDTELSFSTDVSDDAAGVTGTAGATDADQHFEFDAITPQTGTPQSMSIKVATVEELTVDYTTDYSGQFFRYTDKAGVAHTGTFTNGIVNF